MEHCEQIEGPNGTTLYFSGPKLSEGTFPAVFYFCVGGQETLSTDPFNQFSNALKDAPIRVFSFDIPEHGPGKDNQQGVPNWAERMREGKNVIADFVDETVEIIDFLSLQGWIDESALAVAGLSRGGFISTHIAAADSRINTVLAFAPMTRLSYQKSFADIKDTELVQSMNLQRLTPQLTGKRFRFYMGNRDVMVSTRACFEFIEDLAEANFQERIRTSPVEMIINPAIGHQGHGTSKEVFEAGAEWIKTLFCKTC